jgi:hypothetical protein
MWKSVAAASIFSRLKIVGSNVELVDEYAKTWAWEKRQIESYDQGYLFMKQLRKEHIVLRAGGALITDSPLTMSVCYARRYGFKCWENLQAIADQFEQDYPSINILLNRGDCEYQQEGRYEDHDQAVAMDKSIREHLVAANIKFVESRFDSYDFMIGLIRTI